MTCIQETLAELRSRRDAIDQLIVGIERTFNAHPVSAPAPTPIEPKAPRAAKKYETRVSGAETVQAARRLAEPFTAANLAAESGVSVKAASSAIARWLKLGWVVRVGFGLYNRSKTFGGQNATAASSKLLQQIHEENAAKLQKKD